jgi:mannose-1-phosphate guanylyltransferase
VIFDGVHVGAGAVIERSIIGFGARIRPRASPVALSATAPTSARCELLRGAQVWPEVTIPDGGIRLADV